MALHSLRDIKRRIRSVQNTQQITRAMEMVSAAKLRRAQNVVLSARPYDALLREAVRELALSMEAVPNPYFERRRVRARALVVVTSDKGLCGAFNSNVLRRAEEFLREGPPTSLVTIGKKALDYFKRRRPKEIVYERSDLGGRIDLRTARTIAAEVGSLFLSQRVDEVHLLYTKFISAMRRKILVEKFLPVEAEALAPEDEAAEEAIAREYIMEPSAEEMLKRIMPSYAASRVYMALAESFAAEHGARMIAMSAATKNAEEMIERLILTRNRVRQATITKELSEIVGCIEALKYVG